MSEKDKKKKNRRRRFRKRKKKSLARIRIHELRQGEVSQKRQMDLDRVIGKRRT